MKYALSAAVLTALSLAACATNPVTGQREYNLMSEAQEAQLGQEMDPQVRAEMGLYPDSGLQEYVQGVGMRLAKASERPDLPWRFAVVDVPAVNAFALPGGYIYITRGLLAHLDNEAELAGVLGHEIGHVTARHAARAYTRQTSVGIGAAATSVFFPEAAPYAAAAQTGLGVLFLKYHRSQEVQSDSLGARYAAKEGWQPAGMEGVLETLGRISVSADRRGVPNWLATHPQPADRVAKVSADVEALAATRPAAQWTVNRDEYLSGSTASCSVTTRARDSSAAASSSTPTCASARVPGGLEDREWKGTGDCQAARDLRRDHDARARAGRARTVARGCRGQLHAAARVHAPRGETRESTGFGLRRRLRRPHERRPGRARQGGAHPPRRAGPPARGHRQ